MEDKTMTHHAKIRIDDWYKHPYSIEIFDENENRVVYRNFLDSEEECFKIIEDFKAKGNVVNSVETEFY